jgi:AcrR family transcriptional regulator
MPKHVKRPYDGSRRQAQAQATRRAILMAAGELFVERGYASTTMQGIADEAGVAVQTVYAAFGSKRELLRQLLERSITGDDEAAPVTERPEALAVADEPDARSRARMYAALSRTITERVTPVFRVMREAAASDPEFAGVLQRIKADRRDEMVTSARRLAGPGKLQLPDEEAAAALYVLFSPDVGEMLMGDYGWSAERFEDWLATMLYRTLLRG